MVTRVRCSLVTLIGDLQKETSGLKANLTYEHENTNISQKLRDLLRNPFLTGEFRRSTADIWLGHNDHGTQGHFARIPGKQDIALSENSNIRPRSTLK